MSAEELEKSLQEYNNQKTFIEEALKSVAKEGTDPESLKTLLNDINQLIELTKESLDTIKANENQESCNETGNNEDPKIDDEYALFMAEMAQSGAYDDSKPTTSEKPANCENPMDTNIDDELSSLLGMKCAVYHTHKWGGQPTLHNAMVMSVVPHEDDLQFKDLEVRVLFTHPTQAEMLPCPFFLSGECKFDDEKCRYSHGTIVLLSDIKDAIEPNFDSIKIGSRVLLKLKPPDDLDMSVTKKSTEKYHLWHQAVVRHVDVEKRTCVVRYEHGVNTGEKRKAATDEVHVPFEHILPLNNTTEADSDDSLSDTEYLESKQGRPSESHESTQLIAETSANTMGEWERHTRGIGSKLMLAMGYVPGTGLGASGDGRVAPVEAALLPKGRSLDAVMEMAAGDSMKVELRLKRLQKKEEEKNKRALEREQENERRNVFNFLNRTLGDKGSEPTTAQLNIKQTTSKDLNIEQFKITEETRRLEREITKLHSSLQRYTPGTPGHSSIAAQLNERNSELQSLRNREQQITREQNHRKDKQKMTIF